MIPHCQSSLPGMADLHWWFGRLIGMVMNEKRVICRVDWCGFYRLKVRGLWDFEVLTFILTFIILKIWWFWVFCNKNFEKVCVNLRCFWSFDIYFDIYFFEERKKCNNLTWKFLKNYENLTSYLYFDIYFLRHGFYFWHLFSDFRVFFK